MIPPHSKQKIPIPKRDFERRTNIDFPKYRYVPGLNPHPIRDPNGHLYNGSPCFPQGVSWDCDEQFLYGADLFDARFVWEAHENWEHCWRRAFGRERQCIQGLIQIAASVLKHHLDDVSPRDRLFSSAKQKLSCCAELGWDFRRLLSDVTVFFHGGDWPLLGAGFPRR